MRPPLDSERQFTLRAIFGWIAGIAVLLAIAIATSRRANEAVLKIERDAARRRVQETGNETEYDRNLLGYEVDSLKLEYRRPK